MKTILYSLFVLLSSGLISCAATDSAVKGTTVQGQITDATNMKVFFDQTGPNNQTMVLAQTETDATGKFAIKMENALDPGIYRLRIGAKRTILILEDKFKKINIQGDLASLGKYSYEISGSESATDFASMMKKVNSEKMDASKLKEYISQCEYPFASMQMALNSFGAKPEFWEMHQIASKRVNAAYPDNTMAQSYKTFANQLQQQYVQTAAQQKIKIGELAPEIALESPDGKIYKLSDLKGQIVLIDFWASWCGPCRKNNPHVVSVYQKYKDQGFTVYSVSLDGLDSRTKARYGDEKMIQQQLEKSKQRWVGAIKKDNLTWDYHVSELAKWDTQAAKMYGVRGIPRTFLIDRDGKIAAINPRNDLEEQLKKVL